MHVRTYCIGYSYFSYFYSISETLQYEYNSSLACKYETRVEVAYIDKPASLLHYGIDYVRNSLQLSLL